MVSEALASDTPPPQNWWSSAWVKVGLSAALLAVLLLKTDLSDLRDAVLSAEPWWVLAALIGYVASQVVASVRWTMLARPLGFDEPYGHFFSSYFTGVYLNLFSPSTVAGLLGLAGSFLLKPKGCW